MLLKYFLDLLINENLLDIDLNSKLFNCHFIIRNEILEEEYATLKARNFSRESPFLPKTVAENTFYGNLRKSMRSPSRGFSIRRDETSTLNNKRKMNCANFNNFSTPKEFEKSFGISLGSQTSISEYSLPKSSEKNFEFLSDNNQNDNIFIDLHE